MDLMFKLVFIFFLQIKTIKSNNLSFINKNWGEIGYVDLFVANIPFSMLQLPFFCLTFVLTKDENALNLIIDIGNTMAKVALFDDGEPVEVLTESNQSLDGLQALCSKYPVERGIVATVIDLSERVQADLAALPFPLLRLDHQTPLPVVNLYETPETLGYDRMAAVVGANELFPHRDILVIDAGTCITYEFIDSKGQYHGGNISPGMQMRFKALHRFTGRLPLVGATGRKLPMGRDTETAIRAGVMKGMEYEISGYIESMKHKYPELLVFLTGGDEFSFDSTVKSIIFADRFLVLKGLNRILNYNNGRI